jgi:GTPase SAR1 family protein
MGIGIFARQTTACPYCYKEMDVTKVAFRCTGRGAPGLPACEPVPNSKRKREFSDSSPVMPSIAKLDADGTPEVNQLGDPVDILAKTSATCLRCGGASGVRMCPECHSILPRSFDTGSPMFGLVGVRNSGKTVLLSVLHKELVRKVAKRFNSSIDTPGGSTGLARDLALFEETMSRQGGTLPPQTAATGAAKKTPAVYEWKYRTKNTTASTIFSFYDSAGEDISRQDQAMMQQYLGQSSGVILLLDPFAFPENVARAEERGAGTAGADTPESALDGITYVLQTTHNVKRNKKIKVPLAVVISKIDAFFDQVPPNHPLRQAADTDGVYDLTESQTIHDHVAAMITQWGGDGLLRKLENEYSNYRLFGVSALGAEPEYRSGEVNTRGLLPHRVADPLLWLMADRGFIPSRES